LDAERGRIVDEMLEAGRPVEEEAVARFRAAFAAIPATERRAWWDDHRLAWTPRADLRALARELLGRDIEDEVERRTSLDAVMGPIRALDERIVAARHLGFTTDLDGTAARASHPALEAAIEAAPDDPGPWLAYGDWLQLHGDPRGELVIAQDGSPRGEDLGARLLDRHERYFLGGLARHDEVVTCTWRRGFLRTAKVVTTRVHEEAGIAQAPLVRTLLDLPSARFLEELTVGCASIHEEGVAEALIEAMVASGPRPTLRRLAFTTYLDEEMLSWTSTGPLGALWPLYPHLTSLELTAGGLDLGDVDLPHLARLRIETCGLTWENLQAIVRASLPALRELELWFGASDPDAPLTSGIAALLASPPIDGVTRLGFVNTDLTDELVAELVATPHLARLTHLDLSRGTLSDAGGQLLGRALADGLAPQLRSLDVGECYLTAAGLEALRAGGLAVRGADDQREPEPYDGVQRRFVSVSE
ncbi:MAG: TIGR02996 domain-containing protein, partial [Myxococcota bacterium]|nr:TIGR02996 domain-containing protein [Myxococcota bacterium]